MEAEAELIVAALRRGGVSVATAYRGNAKRRAEVAAKANPTALLYVRNDDDPASGCTLIDKIKDAAAAERLLRITAALPEPYHGYDPPDMIISPERIAQIERRHADLAAQMGNPDLAADKFVQLSKDYAELTPVVEAAAALRALREEAESLKSIPAGDEMHELAQEELGEIEAKLPEAERALALKLLPKDAADAKPAMLEIRAGTGGDEAALFAGDLYRMYERYAATRGWRVELVSASAGEMGGFKEVIASVTGDSVFARLKFESGVHRVQRVPATETQGRIHTVGGDGGGAARGRGSRYPDRREGSAHRHLPFVGPGRPVGQHHRQRGAHRPYPDGADRSAAGRKVAAQEQGQGHESAAVAAV